MTCFFLRNYRCGNLNSIVFNRDTTQVTKNILNLISIVFSGHLSTSTNGYILIDISLCCQVPLLTARSRLDMGEEKIANEIDDYFRFSLASHWYWG